MICEAWLDLTGEDLRGDTARIEAIVGQHGPAFDRIEKPTSPSIVVMIRPPDAPHAGLYRNGRVLHIREDGARFERLDDAIRGFTEVRYYAKRHTDQGPARTA